MASSSLLLLLLLMMGLTQLVPHALGAAAVKRAGTARAEVCYEGIGCFNNGGSFYHPLQRPVSRLPQPPAQIGITFKLFTRWNVRFAQNIVYNQNATLRNSNFRARRHTKIIIHGFTDDSKSGWMESMKDALLRHGDYNVLLLDWSGGNWFPYSQAVANTRVVGALTSQLILWLESAAGASRSRFHLLGHSLGAHIAGYAGERLSGRLGRITGMDPAGPYFSLTPAEVKLDPTDAEFVDVIHTDGANTLSGAFGLIEPLGHVDFYPNGGKEQVGCDRNPIVSIIEEGAMFTITCNHNRVMPLMTATILNPSGQYRAVQCRSYQMFRQGRCTCDNSECAMMGIAADKWNPKGQQKVKMYVDTSDTAPFEVNQFVIRISFSDIAKAVRQYGDLSIELQDSAGRSSGTLIPFSTTFYNPGDTKQVLLTVKSTIASIRKVRFEWRDRYWIPMWGRRLFLRGIHVQEWKSGDETHYCAKNAGIESEQGIWFASSKQQC